MGSTTHEKQALLGFFDEWTLVKGREYFLDERAELLGMGKDTIFGKVRGAFHYDCTIRLSEDGLRILSTRCSCPVKANCKHTAALALRYLDSDDPFAVDDNSGDSRFKHLTLYKADNPPKDKGELKSSRPKASLRLENALRYLNYTYNFEKSSESGESDSGQTKGRSRKSCVIYILSDLRSLKPSISIEKISVLKDGSFGKSSPVHISGLIDQYHLPQYIERADVEIAAFWESMRVSNYHYSVSSSPLLSDPELVKVLMTKILATGRCYRVGDLKNPLKAGPELPGEFEWNQTADGQQHLRVVALNGATRQECLRWGLPWYIDDRTFECGPVKLAAPADAVFAALQLPAIGENDAQALQILLPELGLDNFIPKPKSNRKVELRLIKPVPELRIEDKGGERTVVLAYDFPDEVAEAALNSLAADDDRYIESKPDFLARQKYIEQIKSLGFSILEDEARPKNAKASATDTHVLYATTDDAWLKLFEAWQDKLAASGWRIPDKTIEQLRPLELDDTNLDLQIDYEDNWWFTLEMFIEIGGARVPLLPILLSAIRALPDSEKYSLESIDKLNKDGKFFGILDNGKPISLPFARIRPILIFIHELLLKHDMDDSNLEFSVMDAEKFLDETLLQSDFWKGADGLLSLRQRLKNLNEDQVCNVPASLNASLRPYQIEGLVWLQQLRSNGFSGILADDMGLGKTVQLLALICAAKEAGELNEKPFLVVCPTSVLPNWLSECQKFGPSLKVLPLSGPDRSQHFSSIEQQDLVLSTYPLISRDIDVLKQINWGGLALDEAQMIKNQKTLMAKTARLLRAENKFCLTGTPIENHLGELWSQFQFLMPGFLGDPKEFRNVFRTPIEQFGDNRKSALLAHRVSPFILRRKKEEVAKDLPEKTEIVKMIELEGAQLDLYETVRVSSTKKVRDEIAAKGFKKSQIMILDALLKLRQACCDPRLVKLTKAEKVNQSAKLAMLMEMLIELNAEGRKVLVFSQFTSMLDLIAVELGKVSIPFVELRGDTTDRVEPVKQFQNGKIPVFLLSLKAGGTGLNLTAADTVIHYDPWWNPAVENQATDRAHRIGQDKNVFVYKLVVRGSIEEKMLRLKAAKQQLADSIYTGGGSSGFVLEQDDIDFLLRPIHEF